MLIYGRLIKKLGIFLAIFLIISIFVILLYALSGILNINNQNNLSVNKTMIVNKDIMNLEIELKYSKLIIKESSVFKIETNNENIKSYENNNKLLLKDEKNYFFTNKDSELIIYLPSDLILSEVKIESGAGSIQIDSLKTNNLKFDLGAGKGILENLIILNEGKIETGAGSLEINNGSINDLNINLGVGKFNLTSNIKNLKLDSGIGEVNLNILNKKDNYTINVDKGIGKISLDGEKISDQIIGNGIYNLDINGGIGSINLNFQN